MTTDTENTQGTQNSPQSNQYDDEISLIDLFTALWRQRMIIAGCFFLFVFVGLIYSFISPKTYESQTSLLILPPIPSEITNTTCTSFFAPDIYKDLAVASDLMNEVIDNIFADPETRPSPQSLAKRFQVNVNKSSEEKNATQRQSMTLTASIKGQNPQELPPLLKAWSNAYIQRNSLLFVNRTAQSYDYISESFLSVKNTLREAEDTLNTYKKQNPKSILSIQIESTRQMYGEILIENTKKIRSLPPLEAKAKVIRELLSGEPERLFLARGMTKESLWAFLSQRLSTEELKNVEGLNITDEIINQSHQNLKSKLYDLNIEIASIKTSIADLGREIARSEKEILSKTRLLQEINTETERLEREVTVLKESFNALAKKYQDSKIAIAEAADPIRVIEEPIEPVNPIAPKNTLIVALSGILGLFVGIFAALVTNMIQNHLKTV